MHFYILNGGNLLENVYIVYTVYKTRNIVESTINLKISKNKIQMGKIYILELEFEVYY